MIGQKRKHRNNQVISPRGIYVDKTIVQKMECQLEWIFLDLASKIAMGLDSVQPSTTLWAIYWN